MQDFNNDGFADIVTANLTDKNVSAFLNNGNGSFGSANNFPVGVGAIEVASGDLDSDGNADLIVTDAEHVRPCRPWQRRRHFPDPYHLPHSGWPAGADRGEL